MKLAESFGAKGYKTEKANEFYPTLEKALSLEGIYIIDVPVNFNENLRLTKQLG